MDLEECIASRSNLSNSDTELYTDQDTSGTIQSVSDISELPDLELDRFEKEVYIRQEQQEQQLIRHEQWKMRFVERKTNMLNKLRSLINKKH